MRENKFEKSHIHILESETLSRESRVTESEKRLSIQPLIIAYSRPISTYVKTYFSDLEGCFTRMSGFYLEGD